MFHQRRRSLSAHTPLIMIVRFLPVWFASFVLLLVDACTLKVKSEQQQQQESPPNWYLTFKMSWEVPLLFDNEDYQVLSNSILMSCDGSSNKANKNDYHSRAVRCTKNPSWVRGKAATHCTFMQALMAAFIARTRDLQWQLYNCSKTSLPWLS